MADNFHIYLKKQLLDYVENERKKGVPLDSIEATLVNAGHQKNIIDEVFSEIKKEETGNNVNKTKDPIEKDLSSMLKKGFSQFLAQAKTDKEIKEAQKEVKTEETEKIVKEVIEEAEIIEEKTMLEGLVFFIYLVLLGVIIILTAGSTGSEIVNVALGFIPVLLNVFVSFFALKLADNVPLYMFIPLGITSAFYALGRFGGILLFNSMDIEALSVVNFLLSFIFNILIVYVRFLKPKHMKKRTIKKSNMKKSQTDIISNSKKDEQKIQQVSQQISVIPKQERQEIKELKKEFKLQ